MDVLSLNIKDSVLENKSSWTVGGNKEGNIIEDVRTFLKRAKEVQAGGQVYYGGDIYDEPNTDIHNIQHNNQDVLIFNSGLLVVSYHWLSL